MFGLDWNAETIERLRELWASGLSASEIGRELKTTRSAVLGKIFRLKLPPRKVGHERRPTSRPKPRPKPQLAVVPAKSPALPLERPRHLHFFELGEQQCRYPYGVDDFCGGDCAPRMSYCPAHMRVLMRNHNGA